MPRIVMLGDGQTFDTVWDIYDVSEEVMEGLMMDELLDPGHPDVKLVASSTQYGTPPFGGDPVSEPTYEQALTEAVNAIRRSELDVDPMVAAMEAQRSLAWTAIAVRLHHRSEVTPCVA